VPSWSTNFVNGQAHALGAVTSAPGRAKATVARGILSLSVLSRKTETVFVTKKSIELSSYELTRDTTSWDGASRN
jgi:hypothetical protein